MLPLLLLLLSLEGAARPEAVYSADQNEFEAECRRLGPRERDPPLGLPPPTAPAGNSSTSTTLFPPSPAPSAPCMANFLALARSRCRLGQGRAALGLAHANGGPHRHTTLVYLKYYCKNKFRTAVAHFGQPKNGHDCIL